MKCGVYKSLKRTEIQYQIIAICEKLLLLKLEKWFIIGNEKFHSIDFGIIMFLGVIGYGGWKFLGSYTNITILDLSQLLYIVHTYYSTHCYAELHQVRS